MRKSLLTLAALLCAATVHAQTLGVLGDSNNDEYRGSDNRGAAYAPTTFNWVELMQRKRGVDVGPWGVYASPRRTGYEYNFALSGSLAQHAPGQATGLAPYVSAGTVDYVVLFTGANDFRNSGYDNIYNGTMTDPQVTSKINTLVGNLTTAMNTIMAASPTAMVVVGIGDIGQTPAGIAYYTNACTGTPPSACTAGRNRVTAAINTANAAIASAAATAGVTYVAQTDIQAELLTHDVGGSLYYDGELVDTVSNGCDEGHCAQLGDFLHIGTLINGSEANVIATALGLPGWTNFTDKEIVQNAGVFPTAGVSPVAPTSTSVCSGTTFAGSLSDTSSSNDVKLDTRSVTSGSNRIACREFEWTGIATGIDLTVQAEINSSSGSSFFFIEAWNQGAGAWQIVEGNDATRLLGTSDVNWIFPLTSAYNNAGTVKVRFSSGRPGTVTTNQRIDLVRLAEK